MGSRWLGPKHAHKVRINPLHFSTKIEDCKQCIRCLRVKHKSAFRYHGVPVGMCQTCREEIGV